MARSLVPATEPSDRPKLSCSPANGLGSLLSRHLLRHQSNSRCSRGMAQQIHPAQPTCLP